MPSESRMIQTMTPAGTLRPVLGDQISDGRLSSLSDLDPAIDVVLFAEVREEATYVPHHRQKIALIFAGMRSFAERLRAGGVRVRYVRLDDPDNTHSITGEIERAAAAEGLRRVVMTEPGEWRLKEALDALARDSSLQLDLREDDRFICSHATFRNWARGKQTLRMELFYRHMRQTTGLLMDGREPCGGRWNFDAENRKRLPKTAHAPARQFSVPNPIARQALEDVARWFPDGFGSIESFSYPTEPQDAERLLSFFLDNILPGFGDYQDAMAKGEPWLWHSVLST